MKKYLFLFILMALPVLASAEEEVEIDGLWYKLIPKGQTAEVIKYKSTPYSGDIIIPGTILYEDVEYSVNIGGGAFNGCDNLISITILNGVKTIGSGAFQNCSALTSVIIPNSVISIGEFSFDYCVSLTSITIPNVLSNIGASAFRGCSGLTEVYYYSNIDTWCNITFTDAYSNPLTYAHHLYINNIEVKDIVIPNNMTGIGDYIFSGCSALTSIIIPNSVTSIGNGSFLGCSALTSIIIPNSVTSIGQYAFEDCSALTSITIPSSVSSIGSSAFWGCSCLTSINIPTSLSNIENSLFQGCSSLTSITIPTSVLSIGNYSFKGCSSLASITIPNSVKSIGKGAFAQCSSLISVVFPNSINTINEYTFNGCSTLPSVTIPDNVTSIGNYAFLGCKKLTSLTIGSSVNTIGNSSFAFCQDLVNVYCRAEVVPATKSSAFTDSYPEFATLYVPAASIESYQTTVPWSSFGTIKTLDGETPIEVKCAKPTITYGNGKVKFACETEGVEFVPTISFSQQQSINGNELAIGGTFTVSVYAVKEGYDNSDTATMTVNLSQMGDVNADGELNAADITALVNAILGK